MINPVKSFLTHGPLSRASLNEARTQTKQKRTFKRLDNKVVKATCTGIIV